ncbi:DUF4394 domain-containing protein [Aurantimonas coralicida]|uniref:DUF4394 domain-containing protein n=1 Tax=Aurantimonas coralicida TaxID=182270 RepID=UPI001D18615A|nr:DUF4394 domain-containing protein [Aurantimonas coralicida]MCC4297236.1 DUF4394 domain-containing protein [Aurantimonas coralicida]
MCFFCGMLSSSNGSKTILQGGPLQWGQTSTLAAVGKLGLEEAASNYAFDIATDADMNNTAWLVNGTTLYQVDLESGTAEKAGMIEGVDGTVRDITIMPAM